MASLPERTVESWLAAELEVWFPDVLLWAPTQNALGNWDLGAIGAGKLLIFECKGCQPLVQGHSILIDRGQLWRYAVGHQFVDVRSHVFYVLPAPPWQGEPPAWAPPPPPVPAVPVAHAGQRIAGPAGGCWQWFHVIPATALYGLLTSAGLSSVNTRRLPNAPGVPLPPHPLGPLGGTQRLANFLEDVAMCRRVPVTGARESEGQQPSRNWTRPPGRAGTGEDSEEEPPSEPPARDVGEPPFDESRGTAPTPIAAFIPVDSLAV